MKPGERIVGNTVMYSAAWLDNGSEFLHADRRELLNALPGGYHALALTSEELVWLYDHLGGLTANFGRTPDDRIYDRCRDLIRDLLAKED